ncbi:hypothetical protein [Kitasatospora sp. NPDC050543]|uniref:hypothetical protein n=1 Tax=Kitasatospora sp. NPDC050543 TaxID=3364054 RepID=UPI0037969772
MAAIVYFNRIAEGADSVQYVFGDDPQTMTRTLTVDKGSRRSASGDGKADYEFLKASRKINAKFAESGSWPERGMSVS